MEASLVMPMFLYFMIAFLYFIQIFTIQEKIQSAITQMGLRLSKTAYFYKDFPDIGEALSFDKTIFGNEIDLGLSNITDRIMSGGSLKLYAKKYLDKDWMKRSCIQGGFDGLDFYDSSLNNEDDCIDIVLKYKIKIPVKIFIFGDMNMIQRVRLRAWTGYEVPAAYASEADNDETIVYITPTGNVYHKTKDCSHIKLSISAVQGLPNNLRNVNGEKYKRCEECCKGKNDENAVYYITTDGTRYHSSRSCSALKRTVQEIPLSEVGSRTPCKRCYNNQ